MCGSPRSTRTARRPTRALQTGDIIVAVGSKTVNSVADVETGIAAAQDRGRDAVLFRVAGRERQPLRGRAVRARLTRRSTRLNRTDRVAPQHRPDLSRRAAQAARLVLQGPELANAAEDGYLIAMRILVIEDDREAASYLVKALGEAGHVADQAP